MKLSEKIYYCRKKAGLSQDGLAEKLDVSRQAISKWENGEAMPETAKLPALAKVFGVSIDWLLSEEPAEAEVKNTPEAGLEEAQTPSDIPPRIHSGNWQGIMGKLVRRWGWLAGVYAAVVGGGIAGPLGMLLGVPAAGAAYELLREATENREKKLAEAQKSESAEKTDAEKTP